MKKAFLKKIVTAVVVAATMTTLTPLGVSAASNTSTNSNYYNLISNTVSKAGWTFNNGTWSYGDTTGNAKTGWVKDNGNWYYLDNNGAMQTGVINVNGKTYCLNNSGAMQTGKVIVNNTTYKVSSNGQVIGTKVPTPDVIFDSNNTAVKVNNQTSTVKSGNKTTDSNNQTTTTSGSNSNAGTTTSTGNVNTTTTANTTSTSTTSSTNSTSTQTTNTGTTNNVNTDLTSVDVQGLPQLPKTYTISVQATAEQKILDLMNQKRVEAGLKPLTLDNTLIKVARYKSDHMIQYNYFSHTTPEGTKWADWLKTLGYSYTTSGENIAYNTSDAVELFNQWWNSPGHKANMMNPSFTKVGIGVVYGNGKYMGTQNFSN